MGHVPAHRMTLQLLVCLLVAMPLGTRPSRADELPRYTVGLQGLFAQGTILRADLAVTPGGASRLNAATGKSHVPACLVVGNKKSRIYHVPGGQFYKPMVTTSKNKVCFQTEDEAVKAGYRKSQK